MKLEVVFSNRDNALKAMLQLMKHSNYRYRGWVEDQSVLVVPIPDDVGTAEEELRVKTWLNGFQWGVEPEYMSFRGGQA